MHSEKICFYETNKKVLSIKYLEISKLDLYIDTSAKHSTTYICIYKNSKNLKDAKINFSYFRKVTTRFMFENS